MISRTLRVQVYDCMCMYVDLEIHMYVPIYINVGRYEGGYTDKYKIFFYDWYQERLYFSAV